MLQEKGGPVSNGSVWRTLTGALDALEQGAAAGWYPARRLLLSRLADLPRADLAPWVPEADVEEGDEELVVSIDLPGVDKADLRIEASERALTVTGTREDGSGRRESLRHEQPRGRFARRVALPIEVKPASARAELRNGVLKVTLPRAKPAHARSIKVR